MKKTWTLDDFPFSNQDFWRGFVATSFPTALEKETDTDLTEIIEERQLADPVWWEDFTGYYGGVLDESDGYLDEPTTLLHPLTPEHLLKIEFHPGDTVYYVNDQQIACTGPEYQIQIFPFKDLLKFLKTTKNKQSFFLLLPLVRMEEEDAEQGNEVIADILSTIFDAPDCGRIASSIVWGLTEA